MASPMARADKAANLCDWSTSLFTVFWGIWWAYVVDAFVDMQPTYSLFATPAARDSWFLLKQAVLASNAGWIAIFVVVYVKWLWALRKAAKRQKIERCFSSTAILLFVLFLLLSWCWIIFTFIGAAPSILLYGSLLTLLWPLIVLVTTFV